MYIYQADVYCNQCGANIRHDLIEAGIASENKDDEHIYDSDEFPKGPMGSGESNSPSHCGKGEHCVCAEVLPSGRKIGAWLENELTQDGERYVLEKILSNWKSDVIQLWAEYYSDYDMIHKAVCVMEYMNEKKNR